MKCKGWLRHFRDTIVEINSSSKLEWLLSWCHIYKPKLRSHSCPCKCPTQPEVDYIQSANLPMPSQLCSLYLFPYSLLYLFPYSFSTCLFVSYYLSFKTSFLPPHGSAGKGYAYNGGDKGDMGSNPGSGRSPEVGNSDPLQYS